MTITQKARIVELDLDTRVTTELQVEDKSRAGIAPDNSYEQIVTSSAIVGGAQAANLVVGMIRTKLIAMLIGPGGVGLVGLYTTALTVLGTAAGLGLGQSAVRQVAEAAATSDTARVARTVKVLRRACWFTGILGWFLAAVLAWPLSQWLFGSSERTLSIVLLGATLLLGSISTGQIALIQGVRRIKDLACFQILSALVGTVVSVALYSWRGQRAIVSVLLVQALINLAVSHWLARRVAMPQVLLSWTETVQRTRGFFTLGLAFVWSGLLAAIVPMATQAFIARQYGMEANGIYQAAWALSGLFAAFILNAMGADFYPRLTAVAQNDSAVNRLVNEQTEVGLLLALPGIIATVVFSPWVIQFFYTREFLPASGLLSWFAVGICGRVVAWPLGYIQLAKGAAWTFAFTETAFAVLHIALIWLGLKWLDLPGAAVAFASAYGAYVLGMLYVAARLTSFRWSRTVSTLIIMASFLLATTFAAVVFLPLKLATAIGACLSLGSGFFCLRQICGRLGPDHRLSRMARRLGLVSLCS